MKVPSLKVVLTIGLVYLASAFFWTVLAAETNPYLSIPKRNPFALRPPPREVQEETKVAPSSPPSVIIMLTGVTSVFSPSKALIEITGPGPGKTTRKLILSEGERNEDLEVVSIDVEKSEVTIRNRGAVTNITFPPL